MRLFNHTRWPQYWRSFVVVLLFAPIMILLTIYLPQALIPALLALVIFLIWERWHVEQSMQRLANQIARGELSDKLEVRSGAWGILCHAVNGLLQRQRLQQRALSLGSTLSPTALAKLSNTPQVADGIQRTLTVLVAGYAQGMPYGKDPDADQLAALRALTETAWRQTGDHTALLKHVGNTIMLVFGLFEEHTASTTLQQALQSAQALRDTWNDHAPHIPLALSLASGPALATRLPGVGYTAIGAPIDQALRLQQLASQCPEYALLCSEDAYITLRHIKTARWLPTDLRLIQPDRPPQIVYALDFLNSR